MKKKKENKQIPIATDVTAIKKIEKVLESISKGASIKSACDAAKINRVTFWRWKRKDPENEAKYYEVIDSRTLAVEDAIYNKAIEGDTTAMIFWLKNRDPIRWKDRVEPKERKEEMPREARESRVMELMKKLRFSKEKENNGNDS